MPRCSKRKTLRPANGGSRDAAPWTERHLRVPFTRWKRCTRFIRDYPAEDLSGSLFYDPIAIYSRVCFSFPLKSLLSRIIRASGGKIFSATPFPLYERGTVAGRIVCKTRVSVNERDCSLLSEHMLIFMYSVRVVDKRGRESRAKVSTVSKWQSRKSEERGGEPMNNRNQSSSSGREGGEGGGCDRFKGVIVIIRGVAYSSGNKAAQLLCTHRSRVYWLSFLALRIERGKAGESRRENYSFATPKGREKIEQRDPRRNFMSPSHATAGNSYVRGAHCGLCEPRDRPFDAAE